MYNKCSYPRFILHPHFLIRVLSSIPFSHPRFILYPHFLIRIFSSAIRIRHPYPRFIPTINKQRRFEKNEHNNLYNILSASTNQEDIVFTYHHFKVQKQSFPPLAYPPIGLQKFCPELKKRPSH